MRSSIKDDKAFTVLPLSLILYIIWYYYTYAKRKRVMMMMSLGGRYMIFQNEKREEGIQHPH